MSAILTDVYPRILCPECDKITPLLFDRMENSAELRCETCMLVVATVHEADPTPPVMDRGDQMIFDVHERINSMAKVGDRQRDLEDMIAYLEAALALADKTSAVTTGYLIERALDEARAATWPGNLDTPLSPKS